jgi:glycosyltransferase involved in cell wall biosynthesis
VAAVSGVTRRCIVLVTPYPPSTTGFHGSARVVTGLIDEMVRRHDVVVVHPAVNGAVDTDIAARCRAVVAYGPTDPDDRRHRVRDGWGLLRGHNLRSTGLQPRKLAEAVRAATATHRPDVVQAEGADVGSALATVSPAAARRVLSVYEAAGAQIADVGTARRLIAQADAWAGRRTERRALGHADAAVVYSDADRRRIAAAGPPSLVVETVPLGWHVPARPADPAGDDPPSVVFVGSFIHPPNVDAAVHLVADILPRLRTQVPAVVVTIVGACPPDAVRRLDGDGVCVTGTVADVAPYLDQASVVVAPLRHGGGARVKVLEALAAGKAVVTTSIGAQGVAAPSSAMAVADGDAPFAEAVARLLRDRSARIGQARRARAWAEANMSWAAMVDRLEDLYDRIGHTAG